MGSLHDQESILVQKVCQIYHKLAKLESLKPSRTVNALFTELVTLCIPPSSVNTTSLPQNVQQTRSKLIRLCGEAESHLEAHFSNLLASFPNPLHHLALFPYYSNYLKLSQLEFDILNRHCPTRPTRVAFVGSGPLPLTSIVLASYHLKEASFHNYDVDGSANSMASRLISSDDDLSKRMFFHSSDINEVSEELKQFDVVFLAALVGMEMDDKVKVIKHLAKFMASGAILMLRSAHGARAFLYPVVNPEQDLQGFEVLSVFHPQDDVINSVVIARKEGIESVDRVHQHSQLGVDSILPSSCKYGDHFQGYNKNPLNKMNNIIEELITMDHE